ncbi:GDP-6-deoxy-D-mannose reductase [Brevundimonas sp. NIBR11]|nr:GDP-6-deoxy-D-mannose reductase [Brevundimonas sp. NIBR11]
MKRIMVTGASGFVGRRLTPLLAALPGVEAMAPLGGPDLPAGQTVDILDATAVEQTLRDFAPTDIVHLAAASSVAGAGQTPETAWDVNLIGVRNLAAAARRLDDPVRFLFASTGEVYGRAFLDGPVSEDTPPQPASTYARTKLAAEHLLEDLSGDRLKVTVLRLFNHTGPGQDTRFVVPAFAAQIAAIEAGAEPTGVVRVGNLEARRDFSDVEDILAAYEAVVRDDAEGPAFARYNVGSGQVRTIRSILDLLIDQARRPVTVEEDPARLRPSEIAVAGGVFDRFARRYGWSASTPFERTVTSVLDDQRASIGPASPAGT